MLGLFLFNLVNDKYIFDSYKAEINHAPRIALPPHFLFFNWHFFLFFFSSCFLFSFQSLIGSSEFCSSFLIPSPSIKTLFITKLDTSFPSEPSCELPLSLQTSFEDQQVNLQKDYKGTSGLLKRWIIKHKVKYRLQKVSIKVTVEAAFACPGRFAFIVRVVLGAASIPGREVWFPLSTFCILRSAAAPALTPETTPPVSAW